MAKKPATTVRWNREKKLLEKRCSKCHVWLPADADHFYRSKTTADGLYHQCKDCKKAIDAEYRAKNPDYNKEWKARNPERVKELAAAYRERNRPVLREKSRLYHALNREEHRAKSRARYRRNPEKDKARARAWAEENQERLTKYKKRYHQEVAKQVSRAERQAAGGLYKADVFLPDGTLARILGKRGDLWLVLLYDPIKVGKNEYQRVIQARHVHPVREGSSYE